MILYRKNSAQHLMSRYGLRSNTVHTPKDHLLSIVQSNYDSFTTALLDPSFYPHSLLIISILFFFAILILLIHEV